MRQVHCKEVDFALDLGDLRQRLAKIHLSMAGIMPNWHKYFAMPQTARQHVTRPCVPFVGFGLCDARRLVNVQRPQWKNIEGTVGIDAMPRAERR